jgi:hypothetical protein
MVIFVEFAYVSTLWNNAYADQVLSSWEEGPIQDVQVVTFEAGGLFAKDTACPEGYEIGPEIYYPGLNEGCVCPHSKEYAEVYYNRC